MNNYAETTSNTLERMRKDIESHVVNTEKIARLDEQLAGEIADGEDSEPDEGAASSSRPKRYSKYKNPTVETAQYLRLFLGAFEVILNDVTSPYDVVM